MTSFVSLKKSHCGTLHNIVKGLYSNPNHPIMSKLIFITTPRRVPAAR